MSNPNHGSPFAIRDWPETLRTSLGGKQHNRSVYVAANKHLSGNFVNLTVHIDDPDKNTITEGSPQGMTRFQKFN
jgi:hypothetical protein